MRVCVDTNILVSYLLNSGIQSPPALIIEGFLTERFDLIVSETTIRELQDKITNKQYLKDRIPLDDVQELISLLREAATMVPELSGHIPPIVRDAKDDYLVAHSLMEKVDFLVSGDKDLLSLGWVDHVRIVSPADFVLLVDTLDSQ